ncbi:hypothetical protein RVR_502 [Actinacidiphila reveromycinica]|uniref:Uncharacterized protein n=1 Tax=Actinacidiphila reveromycinica TaxID=659352 RepID=A0A7U3UN17_9ACTN|nr:hypothetical protein RVR_502 [Streptomyces sp. SN-593]
MIPGPAGPIADDLRALAGRALERYAQGEVRIGFAMVSGSRAMGLGHALSDLDLYVVRTDDAPARAGTFALEGQTIQVTPLDTARIRRLAAQADGYRVTARDRSQQDFTQSDYKVLLRLANGALLYADAEHRELFERLDRETVRRLVVMRHATYAVELQEDVRGTVESGDLMTAMVSSQRTLMHAVECALGGVGEVYDHEKVALRRLARHPGTAHLLPEVWRLLHPGVAVDAPAGELAGIARRRALLASHLVGYAVLDGWDGPAARVPPFTPGQRGPVRRYDYGLLRFANGIALTGEDKGARVSEAMARLWLALDGRPFDEIASSPALRPLDAAPAVLAGALEKLRATGAVEQPPPGA